MSSNNSQQQQQHHHHHQKNQQIKHEEILKRFRTNLKYGPAGSMDPLRRWHRAKKFNLNPPEVVRLILEKQQQQQQQQSKQHTLQIKTESNVEKQ
jgi:DNA polymerase delta subunit 4